MDACAPAAGVPLARRTLATNPDHYKVVFGNDLVRVLEYTDQPGDETTPHAHPDSLMYTLSSVRRRLVSADMQREVELESGTVGWLPAQQHHGVNIGQTPTHVIFVELKEEGAQSSAPTDSAPGELGPQEEAGRSPRFRVAVNRPTWPHPAGSRSGS